MGGIPPHFMKMRWFYTIFSSVGWKWCPGGPGAETSTKPMLFLCLFRGSGHPKVGFGVDFHQKSSSGCYFSENHENGWNSAEFHHFHSFSHFWAFPAARGPRKAWNLHVLSRFWQGPPGTGGNADFTCFTMISHNFTKIMILHEFLGFLVIFMILHENHENGDPPAPGRRNSMYYCTISHDMGSSFRWIPNIYTFSMKSTHFHEITIKS